MNTVTDRGFGAGVPDPQTLAVVQRLIDFAGVCRDSNLGLIEFRRDSLKYLGATPRLTDAASGKRANLFAQFGEGHKPGLIPLGRTDVVPVEVEPIGAWG